MLSFSDNQDDLSVSSFDELIDGFNYHYLDLNSQSADLSWDDNELRHNISNVLGSLLDLNSASEILAVTVDLSKIDKLAIENVLSQIVSSSHGYVNNGYDNLFELSSIKTGLINIAFIKNDDFIADISCQLHNVGGHENDVILLHGKQQLLNVVGHNNVKGRQRLIQQNNFWILNQAGKQLQLIFHTKGIFLNQPVAVLLFDAD